ncbi:MAG: mechanosensitive ion channel family protein, partial [Muribaculaceae bacterium]|nr:mechanosensitive ion channel family protein [Muribaculaceae bacterium]
MKQNTKHKFDMKHLPVYFLILIGILFFSIQTEAQLIEKAEEFIRTAFNEARSDSLPDDALTAEERYRQDSVRLQEMTRQLQEMQMNEMLLRTELANVRSQNHTTDSLKLAEQLHYIDSLRLITPGVPVLVDGDTLFTLYADRGGYSAADRAEMLNEIL